MIAKKGKRTLIFKGITYVWFVKKTDEAALLSISSEDKKLVLSYRVDQINDEYIHPKISVLQSEKLIPGVYSFFPPLADEGISAHNVRAILNWYLIQSADLKPLV